MWWCAAADRPIADLAAVLEQARGLGFLGSGPLGPQLAHSRALAHLLDRSAGPFVDLGSGGGLPGLILALEWPGSIGALLDSNQRRTRFLAEAIDDLGLDDRLRVIDARAEDAARDPDLRSGFAVVTARSFAPPAVTAECAVGFLRPGGYLAVSEPPDADPEARWNPDGLARLGLTPPDIRRAAGASVAIFTMAGPVDDRWPRRTGIPAKRPLW